MRIFLLCIIFLLGFPLYPSSFLNFNYFLCLILLGISCFVFPISRIKSLSLCTVCSLFCCSFVLIATDHVYGLRALLISSFMSVPLLLWIPSKRILKAFSNISFVYILFKAILFFCSFLLLSQLIQAFIPSLYDSLQQSFYPIDINLWSVSEDVSLIDRTYRLGGFLVIPTFASLVSSIYLFLSSILLYLIKSYRFRIGQKSLFFKCARLVVMITVISTLSCLLSLSRAPIPLIATGYIFLAFTFFHNNSIARYITRSKHFAIQISLIFSVIGVLLFFVSIPLSGSATSESYKIASALSYFDRTSFPLSLFLPGFILGGKLSILPSIDNDILFFLLFSPVLYILTITSFLVSGRPSSYSLLVLLSLIIIFLFVSSGITLFSSLRTFPLFICSLCALSVYFDGLQVSR